MDFPKYRAVSKNGSKLHEGWPVKSTAGNIYLIILLDDHEKQYPRIGYIEVYPETLEEI